MLMYFDYVRAVTRLSAVTPACLWFGSLELSRQTVLAGRHVDVVEKRISIFLQA
ncbi:MAG: hypothetical protein JO249_11620 [Acidobacteria bacterium]|nr:hypothetical protein [Acidobacteriota bacterium]